MGRGLRQGDPMSPMLFIIVGQILHALMKKAKRIGIFQGIKVGDIVILSYLQFTDDTVFFLKDNWQSVKGIKIVLKIFEMLSGLKVNYSKSNIYYKGEKLAQVKDWASWIGCSVQDFPIDYLGATLGSSQKRKAFWKPIIKKVKAKLNRWRCSILSKVGRLVLLKSVLDSILTYWMTYLKSQLEF